MKRNCLEVALVLVFSQSFAMSQKLPDIKNVAPDLKAPLLEVGEPAPSRRVRQVAPEYRGTDIYHALYLPPDWKPQGKFPVLVEYAGNGPYSNKYGDICTGRVEDCNLGYGISGGRGFIWLCLPFISADHRQNQLQWWGDVEATVDYCKRVIRQVCIQYRGDPDAVILMGFSRGAIACNYIGLHDDEIAALWRAFVAHSHYDGVRRWGYPGDDRPSALRRLQRLNGRPQFISQEISVAATEEYLKQTGIPAPFTFQVLPYRNHTDIWVLRDIPERRRLREWLADVLK